ncbi:MAG: cobalamin-dependent protein, partial [Oscillospiraceae bacterium]|nr:cobalamin-dependent protein [Oscillospiraceae bacterium]
MSSGLYDMSEKNFDKTLDLTMLKPYGDTMNDGKVQLSFTLPVPNNDRGTEAARLLSRQMGLSEPNVAYARSLDQDFTFYVVYGSCTHSVDYTKIQIQAIEDVTMEMDEVDEYIREHIGRKIVVLGASTGTDAHTVGIDAIMNRKGFAGHYGLERYEMIEAYNMGSQVPNEEFLEKARELNADVLLVSQTVTQKNIHIQNLTELIELAEA